MPWGSWLIFFRPQPGAEFPARLRLVVGAVSGAALSLSFTGLYFSIYSWVCVGILVFSLLGARPRVAFASGFLHGLLFVLTSIFMMAAAVDLLMLFLAFEFLSITSYIMVGFLRDDKKSSEGPIKYFLYGSVSSAIMLYAISLLGMGANAHNFLNIR